MKLIFSPYFGSRPYIDLAAGGGLVIDQKAVGSPALLDELELRLGCSAPAASEMDRLIDYVKAMRKALAYDPTLFFADSFNLDEIGTAKVILGWRDALVMALWTPEEASTDKLRGLAGIERHFRGHGYVDRWKAMVERLEKGAQLPEDLEIEYAVPLVSLEGCIRRTLELLKKGGVTVTEKACHEVGAFAPTDTDLQTVQKALAGAASPKGEKISLKKDGTFRHIGFRFAYDALQWAAQNQSAWLGDGTLLVCSDTGAVNDTLRVLGKPTLRSDIDGAPQSLQLFLLGLSLFRSPVDVSRLLSYLRVPVSPIGKLYIEKTTRGGDTYYKSLAHELSDKLLSNGGLEDWTEIIAGAVYDRDGGKINPHDRDEVLGRFLMWEKVGPDGLVAKEDLVSYLSNMRRWADGCARVIDDDPGFAALGSCCSAMETILEDAPARISPDKIARWADGIFSPVRMRVDEAQAGSPECVDDPRNVADALESLVWLGFCGGEAGAYPYAFLSEEECRLLGLISSEDYTRYQHESLVRALLAVGKEVHLVSWQYKDGASCPEHPLLTELKARLVFTTERGEDLVPVDCSMEEWEMEEPRDPEMEYTIDRSLFAGLDKRVSEGGILPDRESYSSIDTLIQYPFDYVLGTLLHFDGYGEAQISDLPTVKGNVAHLYVQTLVNECDKDLARMEKTHAARFDELVLSCAERRGASLLERENALEWGKFRHVLQKSVSALLGLIKVNGYTVVGSEEHIETSLPVIGPFHAFVDLLLKDAAGDWVIFDFKWSEGRTYERRMESRDIIQLALYREAVIRGLGGKVSAYGYWSFPRYEFYTECPSVTGDRVVAFRCDPDGEQEPVKDLFRQVCNSYTYRMDQIRKGLVEEGEMFPLADLQYGKDQEGMDLYPLRGDYYDPEVKARPYGNRNITLKGGLI